MQEVVEFVKLGVILEVSIVVEEDVFATGAVEFSEVEFGEQLQIQCSVSYLCN